MEPTFKATRDRKGRVFYFFRINGSTYRWPVGYMIKREEVNKFLKDCQEEYKEIEDT